MNDIWHPIGSAQIMDGGIVQWEHNGRSLRARATMQHATPLFYNEMHAQQPAVVESYLVACEQITTQEDRDQ
jgi:hypothetical protein